MSAELKALLADGLSYKVALRMAEQARDKATAEIERLRSARGIDADRQQQAAARGQPGLRDYQERLTQFDLQEHQLVRSLAVATAKLKLLRTQEAKDAFSQRDAEVVREQDLRRTAIAGAEAHLFETARALTSSWVPTDEVKRAFVQRLGDLLGIGWEGGQISPGVRNRSAERLSTIFAGQSRRAA